MNDPTEPGAMEPRDGDASGTDSTFLDRARAFLDGRLAPVAADALRHEIDVDPALREEFDRLRDVFALTSAEPEFAASAVAADDLVARATASGRVLRTRRWGVVAAAVLVAATLGVAATFVMTPPAPRDVTLAQLTATIPSPVVLPVFDPRMPREPFPAGLADFRPVRDGKTVWLSSYEEATALARETGKPMLVWITHPQCPYCIQLDRETFTDAGVQRDVESFVPVRVNVMQMDQDSDLGKRLEESGSWPYIAVIEADGSTIAELPGVWDLGDVRPKLDAAAKAADGAGRPTWEQVRTAAAELGKFDDAKQANRLGDAVMAARRARESLPAATAGRPLLPIQARTMNFDLPIRAQRVLERSALAADPTASLASLDAAAAAFAGSPEGDDLAAVANAIRETGQFPTLHDRLGNHR